MKKISMLAAVAALAALTACDPYNSEPGGTPAVIALSVPRSGLEAVTAAPWTISGVPADGGTLFVTTNQLLDGASIQTAGQNPADTESAGDCTPAGGATPWITITKDGAPVNVADDAGNGAWYTCYYPAAATNEYGSSILIFRSTVPATMTAGTSPFANATMDAGSTYHFTGTVKTSGGADLAIDVTAIVE